MVMSDSGHHSTMPVAYLPFDRPTLTRFGIPGAKREMRLPILREMLRPLKDRLGGRALVYGIEELMVGTITRPEAGLMSSMSCPSAGRTYASGHPPEKSEAGVPRLTLHLSKILMP